MLIGVDSGGGCYNSGYIQPLDFFGDGPRTPLVVVSRYGSGGHVNHSYADHTSLVKFIEVNWNLPTISDRSRDNMPNPVVTAANLCVPPHSPAIEDWT